MFCSNCGKEIDDKAVVCVNCGCIVSNNKTIATSEKSFVTALLLCLFLGGFGAHRFYTGHTGTAIFQLILSISIIGTFITMVWVFIDLIQIITGSFKTADGKSLAR